MDRSELAIIIPAYNEEQTIQDIVKNVNKTARAIVVSDGSTDDTAKLAMEAGAIVVNLLTNNGYDKALEEGFKKAIELGCKAVVTMDADGEHSSDILSEFFTALDSNSFVLGVRVQKQRFAENLMGWYFKFIYGVDDILCGMKGYRIELYHENGCFDHIKSIGTELAFFALRNKYSFVQIPVTGSPRVDKPRFGSSLKGNLKILAAFIKLIIIDIKDKLK